MGNQKQFDKQRNWRDSGLITMASNSELTIDDWVYDTRDARILGRVPELAIDDWVYDTRNAGILGRVLRKNKDSVKIEFVTKHPIETKTYKKNELKYIKVDN